MSGTEFVNGADDKDDPNNNFGFGAIKVEGERIVWLCVIDCPVGVISSFFFF